MARYSLMSAAKGRFLSLHETTAASPPNPPLAVRTSSAVRGVVGRSLGSSRESRRAGRTNGLPWPGPERPGHGQQASGLALLRVVVVPGRRGIGLACHWIEGHPRRPWMAELEHSGQVERQAFEAVPLGQDPIG